MQVDFIGYQGSSMPKKLEEFHKKIRLMYLSTDLIDSLKRLPRVFYLFYAVVRILYQFSQLLWVLINGNYDYILVQNPPCIPLLFVIWFYTSLR